MATRTFEDWEIASERISHVSNDPITIRGLQMEFVWLGYLDVMINEMCKASLIGSVDINIFPRITMLSRLWMMHAYEVMRSLDEFDSSRKTSSGGSMANFKTGRFNALKKKLEKIRMPMAKQEKPGGKGSESAYFEINNAGKQNISFISEEVEIFREEMAQSVLDCIINYERNSHVV
jgi:hypothetical protein